VKWADDKLEEFGVRNVERNNGELRRCEEKKVEFDFSALAFSAMTHTSNYPESATLCMRRRNQFQQLILHFNKAEELLSCTILP
jgi:hypothetical protein